MKRNSKVFTDEITRVVDKVCSSSFAQTFEKVVKEQPNYFSHEQHVLLIYYPNEITWHQGEQRQDFIERIRRTHLKWFNQWLTDFSQRQPPYIEWNTVMDELIVHTINLFFRIDLGDVIASRETRHQFHQIANTIKGILTSVKGTNPEEIDIAAIPFVQTLLLVLFYFTWDNELVMYLKNLQLVQLITEIIRISNNDEEIHLQAYRILAAIMTEEDIQQLQNSSQIVTVFINFIKDTIDGGIPYEARLHNSLRSLKLLMQYDEICEELIKQNGQRFLLRCAMEDHFNPLKAKLPALECLLALTFNKDFTSTLQKNVDFINHLQTLTSSIHGDLRQITIALLWKLQIQESDIMINSSSQISNTSYDVMISYAQNDKELCHRIYEALKKDKYHVWIDSELDRRDTFDALTEAIKNSKNVLICISDAYKQSPLCKLQANYGVTCQSHIIPLKMTSNYKADGWLGVLTSSLTLINFSELDFEKAYQELKKQLPPPKIKTNENHHRPSIIKPLVNGLATIEKPPVVEYPHCIDNWSKEQVKSFLFDKQLDALLPVFEGMNGQLVHQAYLMCQTNQQGMFLSLKEDVNRSGRGTLTLKDYLTFLKEIKVFVPYRVDNQLNPISAACNLM